MFPGCKRAIFADFLFEAVHRSPMRGLRRLPPNEMEHGFGDANALFLVEHRLDSGSPIPISVDNPSPTQNVEFAALAGASYDFEVTASLAPVEQSSLVAFTVSSLEVFEFICRLNCRQRRHRLSISLMALHHVRDDLAANMLTFVEIQPVLLEPEASTCSHEIAWESCDRKCTTQTWLGVSPVPERLAFEIVRRAVCKTSKLIIVGIIA
ncbi:protein of unknown function [uncultured Sphingopyxis sp.]|uniref:Uncharacterized protein n=1 Tax=uncultured Sphingopyxis sp. TaxID=310581 RepID=A0A1Y5PZS2_9SPHN|nr:protein of unknown function [uncultured Sphingopyxis sp.]